MRANNGGRGWISLVQDSIIRQATWRQGESPFFNRLLRRPLSSSPSAPRVESIPGAPLALSSLAGRFSGFGFELFNCPEGIAPWLDLPLMSCDWTKLDPDRSTTLAVAVFSLSRLVNATGELTAWNEAGVMFTAVKPPEFTAVKPDDAIVGDCIDGGEATAEEMSGSGPLLGCSEA